MSRSTSPDDGPLALLAAAEDVTGLVLDGDAHVFIKEESSSPLPDDDRSPLTARMQPLKFKPAPSPPKAPSPPPGNTTSQQVVKTGRLGGRTSAASKAASVRPQPRGQLIVPRRPDDWEPWKDVLHELYIAQNRILRDIIDIMETKYGLRATPKMYKNQFARWGFFKYAVKRRPRVETESPTSQTSDDSVVGTLVLGRDALMHENNSSRDVQLGLTAVRRFVRGHVELDSANLKNDEVTGFIDPCYRYFKLAMDLFDLDENVQGGRVLRLAFLQIERKISTKAMKSFSDLCFLVPHLLLESGRKEILAAYLRYLGRLTKLKFGKHPAIDVAASFASLVNRPADAIQYVMTLSKVNSDTIASLDGVLDRNRDWARNQYLACQRTTEPWLPSRDRHDHHMLRLEAQSVYWAQKLVLQDPESDAMAEQWLHRRFDDDFGPRCEAYLARLVERIARGELPGPFARMMECLHIGWLFDYCETVQQWGRAFEWGRRGLDLSTEEQYALWSIHLEGLMRRHGRPDEAEELKRRRLAQGWLEKVRAEVDELAIA